MFTILLDHQKSELRVVRADALHSREDNLIDVTHHFGGFRTYALPPGVVDAQKLPTFDNADDAWTSIREDYCPSLHP